MSHVIFGTYLYLKIIYLKYKCNWTSSILCRSSISVQFLSSWYHQREYLGMTPASCKGTRTMATKVFRMKLMICETSVLALELVAGLPRPTQLVCPY